jgi:hypothetical protein
MPLINVNDLQKAIDQYYIDLIPQPWVHLDELQGLDISGIFSKNQRCWFTPTSCEEEQGCNDLDDDHFIITEYITDVFDISKNGSAMLLVESAIFLIGTLGSTYAAYMLGHPIDSLITRYNARECLEPLMSAHKASRSFVRDIFRDFILDLFLAGGYFAPDNEGKSIFFEVLTDEQNTFLKNIYDQEYITLSNEDGRLFADGRSLF